MRFPIHASATRTAVTNRAEMRMSTRPTVTRQRTNAPTAAKSTGARTLPSPAP